MDGKVKESFYLCKRKPMILTQMKRLLLVFAALFCISLSLPAQNPLNDNPDSILGEYMILGMGNDSRVSFTRNPDGTYDCRLLWMQYATDPKTGQPLLDVKNPDKSLRGGRVDRATLIKGLKYDPDRKCWNGAKIYDPSRGIKANVTCHFLPDGRFQLRGSVLGIGEKVIWDKVKK